ncbi:MAG: lysophospholipid acyltransferase family protein [Bradymonadia bacterium]
MSTPEPNTIQRRFMSLLEPMAHYHQHRVEGMEHIPREGGFMLLANHSFATYDSFLLGMAVYKATGRPPVGLGDDSIFKVPFLKDWALEAGLHPANPENAVALLEAGEMVFLAPGGMWEAVRPSSQKYRVRWDSRMGFARLAMRAQVPILIAACPEADDIYTLYDNPFTEKVYRRFKLPFAVARGVGPTPIPRKVPLVHYIAPPIRPPALEDGDEEAQIRAFRDQVMGQMNELLFRNSP